MKISFNGREVEVDAKKVSSLGKFSGLMFRTRRTRNLLFDFGREVNASFHSYFVFFPFLMLWLDDKNRVLDRQIIRPFTFLIRPKRKFRKVVEVPFNAKNEDIIGFFVEKRGKV